MCESLDRELVNLSSEVVKTDIFVRCQFFKWILVTSVIMVIDSSQGVHVHTSHEKSQNVEYEQCGINLKAENITTNN